MRNRLESAVENLEMALKGLVAVNVHRSADPFDDVLQGDIFRIELAIFIFEEVHRLLPLGFASAVK